METLKLGIYFADENDRVISKREIGSNWHIDVEQCTRFPFNSIQDEVAAVLEERLKLQVNKDLIKEMLNEIKEINE